MAGVPGPYGRSELVLRASPRAILEKENPTLLRPGLGPEYHSPRIGEGQSSIDGKWSLVAARSTVPW